MAIGDDCPHFLRRYQVLLSFCDLFNSMSNIILYCFAGRRFRYELKRMVQGWFHTLRKLIPCYCRIEWNKSNQFVRNCNVRRDVVLSGSSTKPFKTTKYSNEQRHEYVKLRAITYPTSL